MLSLVLLACAPRLPSASVEDVAVSRLGWTEAGLDVRIAVDNPLWVAVPLEGVRWQLTLADQPVTSGERAEPIDLGADATTSVVVPVDLVYADLLRAAGSAGGEVPYTAALELVVGTPRGPVTLPLSHEGTLPRLDPPELDLVALRPRLDGTRIGVEVELDVGLPAGITISRLHAILRVDGREVGRGEALPRDERLVVPVWIDPRAALGTSWEAAFGRAETLEVDLEGLVDTPWGTVPVHWTPQLDLGSRG